MYQHFHKMCITLNNHNLTIKMLTITLTAYTKVQCIYVGFYNTYIHVFENLLSAMDALSNARPTNHIIDPPTLDRYLRAILYLTTCRKHHLMMSLFSSIGITTMHNHYYVLLTQLTNCLYNTFFAKACIIGIIHYLDCSCIYRCTFLPRK